MTQHLTWDQISDCLIGDSPASAHAHECVQCRSEIARFESALTEFRGAVRGWSERSISNRLGSRIVSTTIPSRGMYSGNEFKAGMSSLLVNAALVTLLLLIGTAKPLQVKLKEFTTLIAPNLRQLPPKPELSKGGGGSSQNAEVTKGKLPKVAARQFLPPVQTVDQPKLTAPTILSPDLPNIAVGNFGDPLAATGLPSSGNGLGIGIGPGRGPGVGPGTGGGTGGGVFRPGGGVSTPVPIVKPEPEYSEEARKAKWQGVVRVELIVDQNGSPLNIHVTKSAGLGLDEKAIEAVSKWRFKPGMKDGRPVSVIATIEVNFRLL
jgi:TonB family protein